MMDLVTMNRILHAVSILLVGELGRMNTNDDHFVRIAFLDAAEGRDNVDAVDAALGPEIEDDDTAAQSCDRERCRDVEPLQSRTCDFRGHLRIRVICRSHTKS